MHTKNIFAQSQTIHILLFSREVCLYLLCNVINRCFCTGLHAHSKYLASIFRTISDFGGFLVWYKIRIQCIKILTRLRKNTKNVKTIKCLNSMETRWHSFSNTVWLCCSHSQHRSPTSNVCSSNTGRSKETKGKTKQSNKRCKKCFICYLTKMLFFQSHAIFQYESPADEPNSVSSN